MSGNKAFLVIWLVVLEIHHTATCPARHIRDALSASVPSPG